MSSDYTPPSGKSADLSLTASIFSTSTGLPAAITAMGGSGKIYVSSSGSPVTGPAAPIVISGASDLTIEVSPDAEIVGSTTNVGITTAAGVTRYPTIIFSECTDVRWIGGKFTTAAGAPNYSCAIWVGDDCTRVTIQDAVFSAVSGWPIICGPTFKVLNGTDTLHNAGGIVDFAEYHNTMLNCGFTSGPDGGGVRLANDSGQGGTTFYQCTGADLGSGTRIIGSNIFAYDFLNSTQSGWSRIVLHDPYIDFGGYATSATPQKIGINFEHLTPTNGVTGDVTIENPTVIGAYRALQIQEGWTGVTVLGGTYEGSWATGVAVGVVNGQTVKNVTFVAPRCFNNGQSGGSGASGLSVGVVTGNTGTVSGVDILGGWFGDTQTVPTQAYGVSVVNQVASQTVSNVRFRLGAANFGGNTMSAYRIAVGSGTWGAVMDEYPTTYGPATETGSVSSAISYVSVGGGVYLAGGQVDVTALTGTSVTLNVKYTDPNGNVKTVAVATVSSVADGQGVLPISVQAGSTITVSAAFVGTSVSYSLSAFLRQVG